MSKEYIIGEKTALRAMDLIVKLTVGKPISQLNIQEILRKFESLEPIASDEEFEKTEEEKEGIK